jgi:hypothetical protein
MFPGMYVVSLISFRSVCLEDKQDSFPGFRIYNISQTNGTEILLSSFNDTYINELG